MSHFAEQLKQLRAEKGISQKKLAEHLHVSQNAIFQWENEKCEPSIEMIEKISIFFDVHPSVLMGWSYETIDSDYHEFIDLFLGWAEERGLNCDFSHDYKTLLRNDGEQSLFIYKNKKIYEFTPNELKMYHVFLNCFFDAQLELKIKNEDFLKDEE